MSISLSSYLNGKWEKVRVYLQEDLDKIVSAINRLQATALTTTTPIPTGSIPLSSLAPATGPDILVGRGSAGPGALQELTLGSGLSINGTMLQATGSGVPHDSPADEPDRFVFASPAFNASLYVPYVGALFNVDLGIHNFTVDTTTLFVDSVNHRVGVNTLAPGTQLDVQNASGDATIRVQTTSTANEAFFNVAANVAGGIIDAKGSTAAGTTFGGLASANQVIIEAQSASSFYIGTTTIIPMIFAQARVEKMRLSPLGRLGIGTDPEATLHIKAGTTAGATAPLKFNSGPLMTAAEAGAIEFLTDAYYGTITTGAARKTFAFLESPVFTTQIITPIVIGGTAVASTLVLQSTSGVGTVDHIKFLVGNAGGTEAARIIDSGFVGIGATAPQSILHVRRAGTTAYAGGDQFRIDGAGSGNRAEIHFTDAVTNDAFISYKATATPATTWLSLSARATEADFIIAGNGRIGIGTTGPTAMLHLPAGTATASTAPAKLTAGTLLTTPELGAIEFTDDGTTAKLFATVRSATSVIRLQISPIAVGYGRSTAQIAAVASVVTYTVGATDGSFVIGANVLVTTSTNHNFSATVAYTDEGNTARTATLNFTTVAGGVAIISDITNARGTIPYSGVTTLLRCKAATTIVIATTGTFTTVTYNVEGFVTQMV